MPVEGRLHADADEDDLKSLLLCLLLERICHSRDVRRSGIGRDVTRTGHQRKRLRQNGIVSFGNGNRPGRSSIQSQATDAGLHFSPIALNR
jgi:hypothetical protein